MQPLRPATPEDIPRLARLWHAGWHEAHAHLVPSALTAQRTERGFATRLERHLGHVLLGEEEGWPTGFVLARHHEIDQLFTAPSARGTGLAAALLAAGEAALVQQGTTQAHLLCAIGNMRARRFYERQGWHLAATVMDTLELVTGRFPLEVWRLEKTLGQS